MNVLDRVRETIIEHSLFTPGDRVVVGVSGGPDSLALLHALNRLQDELQISLHVAHLNHELRRAESEADAAFVEQIAREWHLPATIQARDVHALAQEERLSLEEAARHARYAFLAEVAEQVGAPKVAVAHNADDQVETILMHFLRGAGIAGLRGMPHNCRLQIEDFRFSAISDRPPSPDARPSNSQAINQTSDSQSAIYNLKSETRLVRPLLDVPRSAVLAYCAEQGLTPRQDASNLDTTYFRNRLRHDVLPYLERLNPNLRQVLLHTARVLADDYELVQGETRKAYAQVARAENDAIVFALEQWRTLPIALQRGTLRAAVQQLRRSLRDIDWAHVEAARRVALEKATGAQATLPGGLMLTVGYDEFAIRRATQAETLDDFPLLNVERVALVVPGTTILPASAWCVETEMLDHAADTTDRWTAFLDADRVGAGLALRQRRPGDRFQPAGMRGQSKSLHEFMIDEKIPRAVRDRLPILVGDEESLAAGDRILWVCGHRVDERVRPTPGTRRFLHVVFREKEAS